MTKPIDPKVLLAHAMKEEGKGGLRESVELLARQCGYVTRHIRDSRGQNVLGMPDELLLHPKQRRLIWAELKREKGTTTLDQDLYMQALIECGEEVYLWRPSDLYNDTILAILKGEETT